MICEVETSIEREYPQKVLTLDRLRTAIVGVGSLGEAHARVLADQQDMHLAGVYDICEKRAAQVARRYNTKTYGSLSELVKDVTAVTVVVPTTAHYGVASYTLSKGLHTFVEKPITSTVEEADQLIKISETRKLVLQVGHIERFNSAFRSLEGLMVSPRFIESHRLASFDPRGTDVSVVHDLMIHDIDLIRCLVQSDLERIDATGVAVISDQVDIANARMLFANGCVANITASRISLKKMRKMRVFERDHYISMNFLTGDSEIYRLIDNSGTGEIRGLVPINLGNGETKYILRRKTSSGKTDSLKAELATFSDAIRGEGPPPVTGQDGREALRISLAVIEQINSNRS